MDLRVGWRKRLPGGMWVGWSQKVGNSRRRKAGLGCGGLFLIACCASVGIVALFPGAGRVTPVPRATSSTGGATSTKQPSLSTESPTRTPRSSATSSLPTETQALSFTSTPPVILNPTSTQANVATFTVLVLTSPIQAGASANVQIQASAGVNCFLSYTTPAGTDSTAAGLGAAAADNNGVCSWTWEIGAGTKSGTGRLAITADGKTQFFDIIIQ